MVYFTHNLLVHFLMGKSRNTESRRLAKKCREQLGEPCNLFKETKAICPKKTRGDKHVGLPKTSTMAEDNKAGAVGE